MHLGWSEIRINGQERTDRVELKAGPPIIKGLVIMHDALMIAPCMGVRKGSICLMRVTINQIKMTGSWMLLSGRWKEATACNNVNLLNARKYISKVFNIQTIDAFYTMVSEINQCQSNQNGM